MFWKKPIFLNPAKPAVDRWLCAPFLLLLYLYKGLISPMLGSGCRFYPSCADYARDAFMKKGTLTACWLTARRLCKCNPFHPGGYDPVEPYEETPQAPFQKNLVAPRPQSLNHPGEKHNG